MAENYTPFTKVTGDELTAPEITEISQQLDEEEGINTAQETAIAGHETRIDALEAEPGVEEQQSVALSSLFRPITEVIPTSFLTTDTTTATGPSDYTNQWGTLWNDANVFNKQGQNIIEMTAGVPAAGGLNDTNGRHTGSAPVWSMTDVEFIFTGDKLDLSFYCWGGASDTQVYIEHEGQMKKAKALPQASPAVTGTVFRRLRFAERFTGRIRFLLQGGINFIQIVHEQNAILRRSPDRPLLMITGDSYVDATDPYNSGSARSFHTFGIAEQILEMTGFAICRAGQGGTGYFNDGTGGTSLTPVGVWGSSPFFSADRKTAYGAFLNNTAKPVLFLVNGTLNDGGLSGDGTNANATNMQAKVAAALDYITATDPYCSIALVGPEPYNDSQVPTTVHTVNRGGMMSAAAAKTMANGASCVFVDANNPTTPFFSGTGSEAAPNSASPQAQLLGGDGIHGNWYGYKHYGSLIVNGIRNMKVSKQRAMRAA